MEKTNVMRILEQHKIKYQSYYYGDTSAVSGIEVATALNQDFRRVFKTLVTVSNSKKYYVFMIPVSQELDLKKAAKSVSCKSISMLSSKELLPLTGYVHGGCSPIGMKKEFLTVIDSSALEFPTINFSAGKIGYQVEVAVCDLEHLLHCQFASVIEGASL